MKNLSTEAELKKTVTYKTIFHFDFTHIFFIIFILRFLNVCFPA